MRTPSSRTGTSSPRATSRPVARSRPMRSSRSPSRWWAASPGSWPTGDSSTSSGTWSTTCPSSRTAGTPARPCASCSTCAAACASARTTPTRRPRSGGSTAGSWGRRAGPAGSRTVSTRSSRRCASEAPHGSRFLYRSSETDALGWACERAGGARMADLLSELVWAPMGAERDAEIICDGLGTAVHDGGLAATARDLLRFGQLLLDGGVVPDGEGGTRTVVPRPVAARRLGGQRRGALAVPRVAERAVLPGWLVPQPVLVPARRARRRAALPGHPRPDGAREPSYGHRVREAVELARADQPGVPPGHAARLRRRRRRDAAPAVHR